MQPGRCEIAFRSRRLRIGLALLLIAVSGTGFAQGFPAFTGDKVIAPEGNAAAYPAAAAAIAVTERTPGETYWVVVVPTTGAGSFATRDYTDELYRRWLRDPIARRHLDPDRHVLIVVARGNRQISIHAGGYLQNTLGLSGSVIDEQVVGPVFVPHARTGNYDRGLAALVPALHDWILRAAAAREARLQQATAQAQARRALALAGLSKLQTQSSGVEARLMQAARDGLAVRNLQAQATDLAQRGRQVAALATSEPAAALQTLSQAEALRQDLAAALNGLAARRDLLRQQRTTMRSSLARTQAEISGPGGRGITTADLMEQLVAAELELNRAEDTLRLDYDVTEATLRQAGERLQWVGAAFRRRLAARATAAEQRVVYTRTLPGLFLLLLLVAAALVVISRAREHARLARAVRERLNALLAGLADLLDRLEGLTERHRLILGTDPDFIAPITGKTRAEYDAVENTLRAAWNQWTSLAAARDEIQRLVRTESALRTQRLQQAEARLRDLSHTQEVEEHLAAAASVLDQLNAAHETVRDQLVLLRKDRMELDDVLERVTRAGLPTPLYWEQLHRLDELVRRAEETSIPDPRTAAEMVATAHSELHELGRWIERVLSGERRRQSLIEHRKALSRNIAARRAEGWLLQEPNATPDAMLALAGEELEQALEQLRAGDDGAAEARLHEITALLERTDALVQSITEARLYCEVELSRRREEIARLQAHLERARLADWALRDEFAPSCWEKVANQTEPAARRIRSFAPEVDRAAELCSFSTQHFLCARAVVEALARAQGDTEQALAAVEARRDTLRAVRTEVQEQWPATETACRSLEKFLEAHRHQARRTARDQYGLALKSLTGGRQAQGGDPPDWVRAHTDMLAAQARAAQGLAAAQSDLAAWKEAQRRVEVAERQAAETAASLDRAAEDRPVCGQRLEEARALLGRACAGLEQAGGNWEELGGLAQRAAEEAAAALEMAQADVDLARRVQAELAAAEDRLRACDRYFGHGVRAQMGSAQARLADARHGLSSRQYEEALRLVALAVSAALSAEEAARAQATRIEEDLERQRRENNEQTRSSPGTSWGDSNAGGYSSSSCLHTSETSSSSSSFDTGTSQSSW